MRMKEINLNHEYTYDDLKDCLGNPLDPDSVDDLLEELNFLMGELRAAKQQK